MEHGDATLLKKQSVLKVPITLCQKQSITINSAKQLVHAIFVQQGQLFLEVGLEDPWAKLRSKRSERDAGGNDGLGGDFNSKEGVDELNRRIFDTLVTKNTRYAQSGGLSMNSVFGEAQVSVKGNRRVRNVGSNPDAYLAKMDLRLFARELDAYLGSGQVLVQGLEGDMQLAAMARFRQFMLDYGKILNFAPDVWGRVVVVLLPPHAKRRKSDSLVPNQVVADVALDAHMRDGCSYRLMSGYHVVKVPCNFRPKQLLDYLGSYLPVTDLTYCF